MHGGDAKEHLITVKVNKSGAKVRHRQRYLDKNSDQMIMEHLTSTLQLGLIENPLAIKLGSAGISTNDNENWIIPLHVLIPAEKLAFLPEGNEYIARVQVYFASTRRYTLRQNKWVKK